MFNLFLIQTVMVRYSSYRKYKEKKTSLLCITIKEFTQLNSAIYNMLLGVDVYHLGMSLSRPWAIPSTTDSSLAMSLVTAMDAAT